MKRVYLLDKYSKRIDSTLREINDELNELFGKNMCISLHSYYDPIRFSVWKYGENLEDASMYCIGDGWINNGMLTKHERIEVENILKDKK